MKRIGFQFVDRSVYIVYQSHIGLGFGKGDNNRINLGSGFTFASSNTPQIECLEDDYAYIYVRGDCKQRDYMPLHVDYDKHEIIVQMAKIYNKMFK